MKSKLDWFEIKHRDDRRTGQATERKSGYPNSWRVTANGRVINHTPSRLGAGFSERITTQFHKHLLNALSNPDKVIGDFSGGELTGAEFLQIHSETSKIDLTTASIKLLAPSK